MKLYLYDTGSKRTLLELGDVVSYTDQEVVTARGVCGPLADGLELSSLPDCSETLRADRIRDYPSTGTRLEELEALVAKLLFGGEAV